MPAWCYSVAEREESIYLTLPTSLTVNTQGSCSLALSSALTQLSRIQTNRSDTALIQIRIVATPYDPVYIHIHGVSRGALVVCVCMSDVFSVSLVCGSPTYLPTYLLTNLPASLRIQSPRPIDGTRDGIRIHVSVCICVRARGIAPLYTPRRHGLLTTVRTTPPLSSRLTNLLRENCSC